MLASSKSSGRIPRMIVLADVVAEAGAVAGELVVDGELVLAEVDLEIAVAPNELATRPG